MRTNDGHGGGDHHSTHDGDCRDGGGDGHDDSRGDHDGGGDGHDGADRSNRDRTFHVAFHTHFDRR